MSRVLAKETFSGVTGDTAYGRQRITMDLTTSLDAMVDGTESYLFLTYDFGSRVAVESGGFIFIDTTTRTVGGVGEQTGALFRAPDASVKNPIVLRFTLPANDPVAWRGAVVVMDGQYVSATEVLATQAVELGASLDPAGGTPGSVAFFGHESAPLTIDASVDHIIDFKDPDHASRIDAYAWDATTPPGDVSGGQWLFAMVTSTIPIIVLPPERRPPPVDADSFWAYPACCECADVFLINNDELSKRWDVPGSMALDQGDTLLLNHTDADGTRWSLTDLDGWWTLPPPELPALQRSGYLDGNFPVDGRYTFRSIQVSGVFIPGPNVSLAVPRQRLLRALDAVRGGALFVAKEPVWAKQAWVYLESQPKMTTRSKNQLTNFEFTLRAVDPVKYHAGATGFQEHEIPAVWSNYLKRTYNSMPEYTLEARAALLWNDSDAAAAPTDGKVLSTGSSFADAPQTFCVSKKSATGVDIVLPGTLAVGDIFRVVREATHLVEKDDNGNVIDDGGYIFFDGVITNITDNTTWYELDVEQRVVNGASTYSKPRPGDSVEIEYILDADRYDDEAMRRGMRFRPTPEDVAAIPPEDMAALPPEDREALLDERNPRLSPNQYRQYQELVEDAQLEVINAGTAKVSPRIYIYGPCANPAIVNKTTGQKMQFVGQIHDGQLLVADCYWRTVTLRSGLEGAALDSRGDLAGVNRRWMLDLVSQWINIVPGKNYFQMDASSLSKGSRVTIGFRSGWAG